MNVASLFATLGMKVDAKSFANAEMALKRIQAAAKRAVSNQKTSFDVTGKNRAGLTAAMAEERFNRDAQRSASAARRERQAMGRGIMADNARFARNERMLAKNGRGGWKNDIGRSNERAGGAIRGIGTGIMRATALGYIAKSVIQSVADLGDEYNNAANRLKVLTKDTAQQVKLQNMLFESSQRTATSFDDTTALYQQIGQALQENKVPLEEGVEITELISKAVKGSGANAQAASKALYQLSQALGSNRLSGDEFRSVIEGAPILIDLFGKSIGKNRGQMRQMAEEQKISAKLMINAIRGGKNEIEDLYAKRIPVLGEVFTKLRGKISKAFGEMIRNKSTVDGLKQTIDALGGVLLTLVDVLGFVMRHGKPFLIFLGALTGAFIALKAAALAAWAAEMLSAGPVGWATLAAVAAGGGIGAIMTKMGIDKATPPVMTEDQINSVTGGKSSSTKNVHTGNVTFNIHSTKVNSEEIAVQVAEVWDSHMIHTKASIA